MENLEIQEMNLLSFWLIKGFFQIELTNRNFGNFEDWLIRALFEPSINKWTYLWLLRILKSALNCNLTLTMCWLQMSVSSVLFLLYVVSSPQITNTIRNANVEAYSIIKTLKILIVSTLGKWNLWILQYWSFCSEKTVERLSIMIFTK